MVPGGEHIAHYLALALTRNMTIRQMLDAPFYHPTLEEGLRSALQNAQDQIEESGKNASAA